MFWVMARNEVPSEGQMPLIMHRILEARIALYLETGWPANTACRPTIPTVGTCDRGGKWLGTATAVAPPLVLHA